MMTPICNNCGNKAELKGMGTGYGYRGFQWWKCPTCEIHFTEGKQRPNYHRFEHQPNVNHLRCIKCTRDDTLVDIGNQKVCQACFEDKIMAEVKNTKCSGCGKEYGYLPTWKGGVCTCGTQVMPEIKIEQMMTCGCCKGTGFYDPLSGPREPCGTCKGEKVVPTVAIGGTIDGLPAVGHLGDFHRTDLGVPYPNLEKLNQMDNSDAISRYAENLRRLKPFQHQLKALGTAMAEAAPTMKDVVDLLRVVECRLQTDIRNSEGMTEDHCKLLSKVERMRKQLTRADAAATGTAPDKTFAELYGSGDKTDFVAAYAAQWQSNDRPFFNPEALNFPVAFRQAEDRVHRAKHKQGDIGIKFFIPNDLNGSTRGCENLLRDLVTKMQQKGIKIETAWTRINGVRVFLEDEVTGRPDAVDPMPIDIKTTPNFGFFMDEIIDDESSLLRILRSKEADTMIASIKAKMDLDIAQKACGAIYYDPETGALTPKP